MISSDKALQIVLSHTFNLKTETVSLDDSIGRVLTTNVKSDRDFPPFDRVSMDGIAINYNSYKKGNKAFKIESTQYAGDAVKSLRNQNNCIEIMTGAAIPKNCDTVIQYEHVSIDNEVALINKPVKKGQNVHKKGLDRKKGTVLIDKNTRITTAEIATIASIGLNKVSVYAAPKAIVISTGNELVPVTKKPKPFQIRMSNSHMLKSMLREYNIEADLLHISDTKSEMKKKISKALKDKDLIIFSGGVSKGKADHVPDVLNELRVKQQFHKVSQRPGKPFWFGTKGKKVVFAFPGNPVSCFCGFIKYLKPFLVKSYNIEKQNKIYAELTNNFSFRPKLTYFLQVKLHPSKSGILKARPLAGHGSGDLANLLDADALLELPATKSTFKKGESYPCYPYRAIG